MRTLIFFCARDAVSDPGPVRTAFAFAVTARRADIPSEVRLAGPALKALRQELLPRTAEGERLRDALREAAAVSLHVTL